MSFLEPRASLTTAEDVGLDSACADLFRETTYITAGEVFPADFVTADQIIEGHRQLIRRAHARGLKIYGGTLTPFEGFTFFGFTFSPTTSPATEAKRQAVNAWIRTSGQYDAVIDFDEVVRDPILPTRLLADYDSGDPLHPNDLGYEAMGNAIDLKLFKNGEGHADTPEVLSASGGVHDHTTPKGPVAVRSGAMCRLTYVARTDTAAGEVSEGTILKTAGKERVCLCSVTGS